MSQETIELWLGTPLDTPKPQPQLIPTTLDRQQLQHHPLKGPIAIAAGPQRERLQYKLVSLMKKIPQFTPAINALGNFLGLAT